MRITYDGPNTVQNGESVHCSQLPSRAPAATDSVVIFNPTDGAAAMPISSFGGSTIVGSPEAVLTASPGATVWDTTDKILYVKDSGTGNTGWLAING
jgi:hypothetical protein